MSRRHEMFRHMKKIHGYQSGDDDNEAGATGDVTAAGDAGDVRVTKQEQHEEEEEERVPTPEVQKKEEEELDTDQVMQ